MKANTIKVPLHQMQVGGQFIYKEVLYTVTEQALGMSEVISRGKFWAWPHYDGSKIIKVNCIV